MRYYLVVPEFVKFAEREKILLSTQYIIFIGILQVSRNSITF